jgi:Putative peptidoglycan binding domain
MKTFFSIVLAVALSMSTALAKHGGRGGHGGHGGYQAKYSKHFSSRSPRGGHGKQGKYSSSRSARGGQKFSRGKSVKYGSGRGRNWDGGNWSGDWGYYGFSGGPFISIGGFGYPYYWGWYPSSGWSISWGWYPSWGWSVPYAISYGYDSYGYYPSYGYDYGYPNYWNSYPDWAWSVPYAFNYDYYSYGYNPSYGYDYGYNSDPAYGYGNGSSIAQLQRRLAKAGYYHGAIDGIMGPVTRRAIRAFERDYGRLSMQ